ncbi:MAG: hypothetical protein AAGI71_16165 [Bacteroidota bacterium]
MRHSLLLLIPLLLTLWAHAKASSAEPSWPSAASADTVLVRPVDVAIAPNPYRPAEATAGFRLRVRSAVAPLTVLYADIYDLHGQRIRRLQADELGLRPIPPGGQATSSSWWDLRTEGGREVPTGTYWVRFVAEASRYGRLEGRRVERLLKFVVIR